MYTKIFPYFWYLKKPRFAHACLRARRELAQQERMGEDAMRAFQWQKLKRLLDHAYANVPFYRRRFDEAGMPPVRIHDPEEFARIPVLTRSEVQSHLDEMVAKSVDRKTLRRNTTGGSTGAPTVFYEDRDFLAYQKAVKLRSSRWAGFEEGDKVAILWGADRDIPSMGWAQRLRVTYLLRQRWLNSYNVTPERMELFAHELLRWRPQHIVAYARSAYLFALFLRERGLDRIRPQSVETSAEKLWDEQREVIEKVFQCKVFNFYGARDTPNIACECEHHRGLHVFADNVYLELLRDGQPASMGDIGEIVVTGLNNYAMPLIRYQNGDLARASGETCPCGRPFPLLAEIIGRANDVLTTPDGQYVHGAFFNHLFFGVDGVRQFQVHQTSLHKVTISIRSAAPISGAVMGTLREKVAQRLGPDVELVLQQVDTIPLSATGKHRYIISEVPPLFLVNRGKGG